MAENGLSNQLETFPPKKYFYIKEQEWSEDFCSKNPVPIPTIKEAIAFLGLPPKESDLPDWLTGKNLKNKRR